ncbi:hypothetical protein NEOLEDRAFT_1142075 [Neolentinus lepideus HHB14362 ss-1]|uniref:Uncharacterized protein n=1 Tax=Neolentinus lepideus HHB14362 ss-1 TaxID=1314782 RepID=A0A165NB38_9AGAM|nr:hypothetical protein NEOLEDRAFT_1142075 [Neolentinus lepideus HHB14362 ss-1]
MPSIALAILVVNILLLSLASAEYHRLKDLKGDCKFTLGDHEYDLCPVLSPYADKEITINMERWTPPTVSHSEYRISLGGPLKKNESRHNEDQCYEGTQVCLTMSTQWPAHKDEPARVAQVVPIAGNLHFEWGHNRSYTTHMNTTASLAETVEGRHPAVRLRLNGGTYVRSAQRAYFDFLCNHTAEEPTSPQFAWYWNGTHGFTWPTKHACGKALQQPDSPPQSPPPEQKPETPVETPPGDQPPPDEHEGELPPEGEQGSFIPPGDNDHSRRNTTIIFFAVLSPIVLLTYLFYSPPLAFRRVVLRTSRRLGLSKFRASETRLVQWASQFHDIEDEEGEEDFMVNGRDVPEEQIPLAPSPKRTTFTNYGSAS